MKPRVVPPQPSPSPEATPSGADRTGSITPSALVPVSDRSALTAATGPKPAFVAGDLVVDRYRIRRFIARGGMGEVYEAEDLEIRSVVALKTLVGVGDADSIERFRREVQLARKVTHPHVCRTFDMGIHRTAEGREVRFLTMELLDGETLSARIQRLRRITTPDALAIVRQMIPALAAAHQEGIIHRDFKSANVILVTGRTGERAVVTDFGLARVSVDQAEGTVTSGMMGTPAYMAPEQVQGGSITPAADIYALGVVLYEMVTGTRPFKGQTALSIAVKRLHEKPVPPLALVADLDPVWGRVIGRCMELRPEERFSAVTDVLTALEGGVVRAAPRQRRKAVAGLAVLGLLALALGAFLAVRLRWSDPAADTSPASDAALPGRRSVAVLGFKNLGRPEHAWLSTALSEMLRTELAAGERLRTIPGESVARMKLDLALADSDSLARDSLSRIRSNLGADLVVLGSYLALVNGKVRVDLRVQDTSAGEVVVSAAEEGTEGEIFGIVTKGGAKIRGALGISAVSETEATAVRASVPRAPATQHYAEGLERLRLFDARGARERLENAVEAEPSYPLAHSALAAAWSALGYDAKAQAESKRALELASALSREERLSVEALYEETMGRWDKAVEIHRSLFVFFPDSLDHGLRLAAAQTSAGKGQEALATVAALRKLAPPAADDPRLDLAEAAAAKALTDFGRQRRAAVAAAGKARVQGSRLLLAEARLSEGSAAVNQGDLRGAQVACEEAGAIFKEAGDIGGLAKTQNIVAVALARGGDVEGAKRRIEQALHSFRQIGDQRGIARQLANLGNVLSDQGDRPKARQLYQEALRVSREIGDRSGTALNLNNLAALLWDQNDLEGARRAFEEALEGFRAVGEAQNEAAALSNLGEVLQKQGKVKAAEERFQASLRISRGTDPGLAAETLGHLATLLEHEGDKEGARKAREEHATIEKPAEKK